MKKVFNALITALISYVLLIQPLMSMIFSKEDTSETVLLEVTKKKIGQFDLGFLSNYKYSYEVKVLRRDGWVGYIDKVYSNTNLKDGKIYGLELHAVECNSWLEYFMVPSIWSHYSCDISDVYNDNKSLKHLNFETDNQDKLFQAIKKDYSFWNSKPGN